jgi:hypothetical protein
LASSISELQITPCPVATEHLALGGIDAVHNLWGSAFYFERVIELGELGELDGNVLELVCALYPKEQEAPLGLSGPLIAQEAVLLDL